jgi:hypothetical protein
MEAEQRQLCQPCKDEGKLAPGAYSVVIGGVVVRVCGPHRRLGNGNHSGHAAAAAPTKVGTSRDASNLSDTLKKPGTPAQLAKLHPVKSLAEKLRGQGLDQGEVVAVLANQGFSRSEVRAAIGAEAMKETDGRRSKVDWAAVQADRNAGMTVAAVAKKYGVSDASVYAHTHGNGRRGGPPRGVATGFSTATEAAKSAANGSGSFHVTYVDIDQIPGAPVQVRDEYRVVYEALKKCPAGKVVRMPLLPYMKASKYPTGGIRSALLRLAKIDKRKMLPQFRVRGGDLYVWAKA